jgi:hypothetical protein
MTREDALGLLQRLLDLRVKIHEDLGNPAIEWPHPQEGDYIELYEDVLDAMIDE